MQTRNKANVIRSSITALLVAVYIIGSHQPALAASSYFSPASGSHPVGSTFSVSVMINAQGVAINSAEAVIKYPADLLEVTSVAKGSLLSMWVEEPSFSNGTGTISFSGGLPTPGYSGSAGQAVKVSFRAKQEGTATVSFASASILANDGLGTNVTSSKGSATFTLTAATGKPATPTTDKEEITTPTTTPVTPVEEFFAPEKWYNQRLTFSITILNLLIVILGILLVLFFWLLLKRRKQPVVARDLSSDDATVLAKEEEEIDELKIEMERVKQQVADSEVIASLRAEMERLKQQVADSEAIDSLKAEVEVVKHQVAELEADKDKLPIVEPESEQSQPASLPPSDPAANNNCAICGMTLSEGQVGSSVTEGPVCTYCTNSDGQVKSCQEVFEGSVQFFITVANGDRALAERLARKNLKALPYWQTRHCDQLDGDIATDEEFQTALSRL